jgi:hypothetical protein
MLLSKGELDGHRILSRKAMELMTTNQLAPDLLPFELAGMYTLGYGYGFGLQVLMEIGQVQTMDSEGEYGFQFV